MVRDTCLRTVFFGLSLLLAAECQQAFAAEHSVAETVESESHVDIERRISQLLLHAIRLQDKSLDDQARATLIEAHELLPEHIPTLIALGKAHLEIDKDRAIAWLATAERRLANGGGAETEHRLSLGQAYADASEPERALSQINQAMFFAQRDGALSLEARALIAKGSLHVALDDLSAADQELEAAGEILSAMVQAPETAAIRRLWLVAVSEFQEMRGAFGEAVDALALLARLTMDVRGHADIALRLGRLQHRRQAYGAAKHHFELAYKMYLQLYGEQHPGTLAARNGLAKAEREAQNQS